MHIKNLVNNFKMTLAIVCGVLFFLNGHPAEAAEKIVMYKNAGCMCCDKWAEHLKKAGFEVEIIPMENMGEVKHDFGIPQNLWSCHTAKIGNYLVEGHVPVDDILTLLRDKPDVLGISVPGMPIGSPGMEMPGQPADSFASVLFTKEGLDKIYAWH